MTDDSQKVDKQLRGVHSLVAWIQPETTRASKTGRKSSRHRYIVVTKTRTSVATTEEKILDGGQVLGK